MNQATEGTGDQKEMYLVPERPAVGSRRVMHRQEGAFNSFPTMYFALRYAEWLVHDHPWKGAVVEQNAVLRAVLRARGPLQMVHPNYTRILAPVAKRTKRFGGDLVELQYAALPPLHELQRRQIFTESSAKGFVREVSYIPSKRVHFCVDAVQNGSATCKTAFPRTWVRGPCPAGTIDEDVDIHYK